MPQMRLSDFLQRQAEVLISNAGIVDEWTGQPNPYVSRAYPEWWTTVGEGDRVWFPPISWNEAYNIPADAYQRLKAVGWNGAEEYLAQMQRTFPGYFIPDGNGIMEVPQVSDSFGFEDLLFYAVVAAVTYGAASGAFATAAATAATAAPAAVSTIGVTGGAELAALVEAGTVGVEGAFLEAAALTGSTVTYSTATGAIISAATPAGAVIEFDAALEPALQFQEVQQLPLEPEVIPEPPAPTETTQMPPAQPATLEEWGLTETAPGVWETVAPTSFPNIPNVPGINPATISKILGATGTLLKTLTGGNAQNALSPLPTSPYAPRTGVATGGWLGDSTLTTLALIAGVAVVAKAASKRK
jgi:hypothetical protein